MLLHRDAGQQHRAPARGRRGAAACSAAAATWRARARRRSRGAAAPSARPLRRARAGPRRPRPGPPGGSARWSRSSARHDGPSRSRAADASRWAAGCASGGRSSPALDRGEDDPHRLRGRQPPPDELLHRAQPGDVLRAVASVTARRRAAGAEPVAALPHPQRRRGEPGQPRHLRDGERYQVDHR